MDKDNFWQKFLDYKRLRDSSIELTVHTLGEIIDHDISFAELIKLNPKHENYESYKEIIDALQQYHNQTIDMLKLMKETLEMEVNAL